MNQNNHITAADPIIGIDLGTTNSLVAFADATGPIIITDEQDRAVLPSVVRLDPENHQPPVIGTEARDHAVEFPQQTIYSIKRLMGRGPTDLADDLAYLPYQVVEGEHQTARVRVGEQVYSPQQISAMILAQLKRQAERHFGHPVRKAVVTVPAYFDDAQRQATRDAGQIAGLQVVRIVNEPTAAALAYDMDRNTDAVIAVYDLGGGTFDLSILQIANGVFQVMATAGDTHLGGDDVDRMIIDLIQQEIREQFGQQIEFPPATRQAFKKFAEATKIQLSEQDQATIEITIGADRTYRRTITRDQLEQMIQPWCQRTLDCFAQALKDAGCQPTDIDHVVMVGGSTRIPLVRRMVGQYCRSQPYTALDPDRVVALGAAVQASIIAGIKRETLLLDVIPLSLGIETMGGAMSKIIMRNATVPCAATEQFSTYADGQTSVKINVLQGERELVDDCRSLGVFDLNGIPPMPAGLPKLEVTFMVDANGILTVSAIEKRSERRAQIQIVPNHGLSRQEVRQMELDSYAHAREDLTAHRLIDLRNQAKLDIRQIEKQLAKIGDSLPETLRQSIDNHLQAVRRYIDDPNADPDAFHNALTEMDHATIPLAERAIAATLQEQTEPDQTKKNPE